MDDTNERFFASCRCGRGQIPHFAMVWMSVLLAIGICIFLTMEQPYDLETQSKGIELVRTGGGYAYPSGNGTVGLSNTGDA